VSIKATWLQDAAINEDALTDLSFGTHRSTEGGGEAPGALDEQVGAPRQAGCWRRAGRGVAVQLSHVNSRGGAPVPTSRPTWLLAHACAAACPAGPIWL
jgi:hypothetical protein